MNSKVKVASCRVSTVLAALLLVQAASAQQSNTVFVFNGGGTGYDAAAEGFAWESAGFTNADGSPMGRNAAGDIVNASGTVVGNRITVGGRVIGWRNPTTNVSIVDINVGTMAQAFNQVTNTGTVRIIKHGTYADRNGNNRPDAGDRLGGALQLDNGNVFSGFGAGTGVAGSNPYPLPARAGATINIELTCCWAGNDPDGAGGAQTSVAASAQAVNGVNQATGTTGESQAGASPVSAYPLPTGVTDAQVQAAIDAAFRALPAATRGRHGNVGDWVNSLPFQDQLRRLREVIPRVRVGDHDIAIEWSIDYDLGTGNTGANRDFPQTMESNAGGGILHETPSGTGLTGLTILNPFLDQDGFSTWETFHFTRQAILAVAPPSGLELVTGIYELFAVDGLVEGLNGTFRLEFPPISLLELELFELDGGSWFPLSNQRVDTAGRLASADFRADNVSSITVAGFARVPEPPVILLLGLGLMAAVVVTRHA